LEFPLRLLFSPSSNAPLVTAVAASRLFLFIRHALHEPLADHPQAKMATK
jgi:hypothetical protein